VILKILGCGTSTGVPMPGCECAVCLSPNPRNKRSRTSALVKVNDTFNILIDTSTDLRWQALNWNIKTINSVLFTHSHADHILGLDDLRGFNFSQKTSIPCYGTIQTLKEIRRCFSYIFEPNDDYEGGLLPQISLHQIDPTRPFNVGPISIQPFQLMHGKMPVVGFKIGEMAYATDCNFIPEETKSLLSGIKVLVLDALRYEEHKTHFTIPKAIQVAQELGAESTYFVHMTHAVDYETVQRNLPENIYLAYDGLEIPF
jgi:phosphoribosyl 1,2-cyclic phosphate phosphodiesterase